MTLSPLVQSAIGKATYYHATCPSVEVVRQHAEALDKLLRQLNAAALAGDSSRAKRLTAVILKSYSAKLTCLVLSHKGQSADGMTMEQLAAKLNMYCSLKEPVGIKLVKKSNGEPRPIVMPGVMRLAAQTMCALIMHEHPPP